MNQIQVVALIGVVIASGASGAAALSAAGGDQGGSQALDAHMPDGYRDWTLISVAHEAGDLNDIRAILGNDIAVKAYRDGRLPFPDGAIIARLAWRYVPSTEDDKVFGRPQSFVAGPATNVQFMIKNSRAYASTGGWGFVQFDHGEPTPVVTRDCFSCHAPVSARDFVYTRYSP